MSDTAAVKEKEKPEKREQWGTKAEFFLACLGYSVGMGSLTRFPYMVMRNGGGAFLIPFTLAMGIIGVPLFYLEVILGQFSGRGPLSVWVICPAFKGIGYAMTTLTAIATAYYMPFTWSMVYLVASCASDVPWRDCNNTWNTADCAERAVLPDNYSLTTTINNSRKLHSPAEEYWNEFILDIGRDGLNDIGEVKWYLAVAHFSTYLLVFLCIIKGAASAGKVVYVTATLPYVLLTILLVRGLTLEGAMTGITYFLKPEWERLLDHNVWLEAAIQVAFQLGPAWGSLITMSRFNHFHHKSYREAAIIPICNLLTAMYSGLTIFSILGYMSEKYNVPVTEVAQSGPGLAFVAYPEALAQLPISPLWSIIFFLMLISVAVDSQLAFYETVVSSLIDLMPSLKRWKIIVSATVGIVLFLVGLPLCTQGGMYIYQILDWYGAVLSFTLIGFLESCVIAYIYGLPRFFSDAKILYGSPPNKFMGFVWFFITPLAMAAVAFIGLWNLSVPSYPYTNYTYPDWSIALGWVIASLSFIPVPITFVYMMWKNRHDLKKSFKPTEEWVPAKEEYVEAYRKRWYPTSENELRPRGDPLFGSRRIYPLQPPSYEEGLYYPNTIPTKVEFDYGSGLLSTAL